MKSSAILILLLLLSVNLMAQKTDSIASKVDLNEIVVTARKTISKGDHELIFMFDKIVHLERMPWMRYLLWLSLKQT